MSESLLFDDCKCKSAYFQAICDVVARGSEARINAGKSPVTRVYCCEDVNGEYLVIEHIVIWDVEKITISLELELRIDEINGTAIYSGPVKYGLEITNIELFHEQLVKLSKMGHGLIVAYNWYVGIDPNEEKSIEKLENLMIGTKGGLFMTSRDELTTPKNFATRFMTTISDLDPAYNEVMDVLADR